MKKNNKKGFTLVELLVVIAILAILATVTVVGYISFTNKAKESNDISLTTQMNTVLQAEEATEGKKADTLSTALEWLKEAGLDVEKLTPTSENYKYIWDKKTNRFYLLNDKNEVVSPEDGKVTNGMEIIHNNEQLESSQYGVYLASDYSGDISSISNKSVELADDLNVETLNVSSNIDIYIAGDVKKLIIEAPTSSVDYYGNANTIEASVADNSLHIYGEVLTVVLKQGRVVAEANAIINTIDTTKATSSSVKVEASNSGVIGAIIQKDGLTIETSNNINKEEVIVNQGDVVEGFAGGVGTENSPYLISNASEFANINSLSEKMKEGNKYYFKQVSDLKNVAAINSINGGYDGGNYLLETKINNTYVFYEIVGHTVFKNINLSQKADEATALLSIADWETAYGSDFININIVGEDTKINSTNFGFIIVNAIWTKDDKKVEYNFKNISVNVNLENEGTCTGVIIGSGPCFSNPNTTLIFENCQNNGDIIGTNSVGFLYGNSSYIGSVTNYKEQIVVKNCKNNGSLISFSSDSTVEFAPKLEGINDLYQNEVGGHYLNSNYLQNSDLKLVQSGSDIYVSTDDDKVNYKLVLNVGTITWNDKYENGTNIVSNGVKMIINLNINNEITNPINSFYAYDLTTALEKNIITDAEASGLSYQTSSSYNFAIFTKDSKNYVIFADSNEYRVDSIVGLLVYSYDNNGNLNGILNYNK